MAVSYAARRAQCPLKQGIMTYPTGLARKGGTSRNVSTKALGAATMKRTPKSSSRKMATAAPGEASLKHTPYGKQGAGFYSDATRGCFDVLARLRPEVLKACEVMLARRAAEGDFTTPFRIADYGTADAGTSMPLVRECIKLIRSTAPESMPIEVLYEDQPGNDWVSVFARTQGTVKTLDVEAAGLSDLKNVFVLASGTSFYSSCFAPGTVDVAFSSTAFHWLTVGPCPIPDALHSACTEDPAVAAAFRHQAEADWSAILAARSSELRPGGRLVIANFAKDVDGNILGTTPRSESMHHNFARIWKDIVTPAEFEATNFPNQYRTLDECLSPFNTNGMFSGLQVVQAETAIVECPYLNSYLKDPSQRTPGQQAAHFVPTTRTWSNSTFTAGLGAHRSSEEKEAMVNALFETYAEHIAQNPTKHAMDYVHSYIVLEKKAPEVGATVAGASRKASSNGVPGAKLGGVRSLNTLAMQQSTSKMAHMPQKPTAETTSTVRSWSMPDLGADIFIASANQALTAELPGNGGTRIWNYVNTEAAINEAVGLAQGMKRKHDAYNTGFSGAKVVVNTKNRDTNEIAVDKKRLMSVIANLLNDMRGTMYTGCDMNTNLEDMDQLSSETRYVLAGIPNLDVNPNDATAFGVLGSLEALAQSKFGGVRGTSFVVHGIGNVGETLARQLVDLGAKVYVYDIFPERASSIPGATVLDLSGQDWAARMPAHDVFVPCSKSNLIDLKSALQLPAKAICGSANLPFASADAEAAYVNRDNVFVPESITSAGAVIADSIEHFDMEAFTKAEPRSVYEFCRAMVFDATTQAMQLSKESNRSITEVTPVLSSRAAAGKPIGSRYRSWSSPALSGSKPQGKKFGTQIRAFGSSNASGQMQGHRGFSSTTTSEVADVCIVGAGIMGMNIAYQMRRRDPALRVKILERAPGLGYGSSGWSTGFLRAFYSFDNTMELALDGINAYKNWGAYTGLGDKTEAYFTHTGALWMLGKSHDDNMAIHKRLEKFNVESEVMNATDISKRFPALSTDPYPEFDLETGDIVEKDLGELWAVYEAGCGHMDSSSCLLDMQAACERDGVNFQFNARVAEVLVEAGGDKVSGVKLEDGSTVTAGTVINCAGPWFQQLNGPIGVKTTTTMLPTRIQVGHKQLPDDEDLLSLPFVADFWGNSGIYFMPRRANKQLVFGSIAHRFESEVVNPDDYNEALDPDVKQDYLDCLFYRCPTMPQRGEIIGFSHMYTVNQEDVHPVIGPSSEFSNYFLCNGFSGHGFKLAPAVGSLMAQQILGSKTTEWETSIPLEFMDPNRTPLSLKVKTHFA